MRKKLLAIIAMAAMVVTMIPSMAFAADNPTATLNGKTYNTLQDALNNAKAGDTITLEAGDYYGNFTIDKNVTIVGASKDGTNLILTEEPEPKLANNNIVHAKADVTLKDLTVKGPGPTDKHILINGIYAEAGLTLDNVAIKDIRCQGDGDKICGDQTGVGVFVADGSKGNVTITNTDITDFNKAAIVSKTYGKVNIDGLNVIGAGPQAIVGQNGIQLNNTTGAVLKNVNISDLEYTAENDWQGCSYGVLAYDAAVSLSNVEMKDIDNVSYADKATKVEAENVTVLVDNDAFSLENIFATVPDGTTVKLTEDYVVECDGTCAHGLDINMLDTETKKVTKNVTFDLNGHTIKAGKGFNPDDSKPNEWRANLVNINNADGFTITNGTVSANGIGTVRHALNVVGSKNVVIDDVTLDHEGAGTGAPLVVNQSDVKVKDKLTIIVGDNSWHGINVDNKGVEDGASLTFDKSADLTYTDPTGEKTFILNEKDASEITNESEDFDLDDKNGALNLHKHEWKWASNDTEHWNVCDKCEKEAAKAPHEFGEWKTTKEPTDAEKGSKERVCEVCGFVDTEEIAALGTGSTDPADKDETAKTGDDTNLALPVGLALVALLGIGGVVATRRRHN